MVALPGPTDGLPRAVEAALAYAITNPLVAAGAVVAALVALYLLVRLVQWYRRPLAVTLENLAAGTDAVSILMHPNPDPDAMAAAVGVAHIVERGGADARLQYPGEIRHQENRAFRTVLDLDLECVEDVDDLVDTVVLVDHNTPRGIHGAEHLEPDAVIDHHPGAGVGTTMTDVRPDYGASATILAEYLQALHLEPTRDGTDIENPLPTDVATALLYGILSDTAHLTKGASPAEFRASAYLSRGIDEDALDRIANPEVDAEVLDVKARAITERRVEGPFAASHVGDVSNVDAIPQAADELLHLEGVTAVVVSGQKDGTIHLSGRSRDDRVHMGQILETVVDDIPMSSAGGHARMGGGQVSADHMAGLVTSSGMTIEDLHDRLFAAMAGET